MFIPNLFRSLLGTRLKIGATPSPCEKGAEPQAREASNNFEIVIRTVSGGEKRFTSGEDTISHIYRSIRRAMRDSIPLVEFTYNDENQRQRQVIVNTHQIETVYRGPT